MSKFCYAEYVMLFTERGGCEYILFVGGKTSLLRLLHLLLRRWVVM
jgi:hypothetical protein